jgi:hypothetical protein
MLLPDRDFCRRAADVGNGLSRETRAGTEMRAGGAAATLAPLLAVVYAANKITTNAGAARLSRK